MASTLRMSSLLSKYSNKDVNFGKYFKGVTKFGKQVMAQTFAMLYKTIETANGTMTVYDYCTQKLGWSNAKIKNTFNLSEREMIRNDPNSHEFDCDVTLFCKIIMLILDDSTLPDIQRKEIRDLKNLRNTVCHEDIELDEVELNNRMNILRDLCRNILTGAASIAGEDVSDFIKEIEDGLKDLLVSQLDPKDIQAYLNEVESYRKEKHSIMILIGRKEAVHAYSKLKILNPFSWLSDKKFVDFSVDKIFTNVNLRSNGLPVQLSDIFELKERRFVPRLLIFSGLMGAGKTSLSRHILHEWSINSSKIKSLRDFDLAIFIELSSVSNGSIVAYLREHLLKNTSQNFKESDIIPILYEMNILFLIDGMDESTVYGKVLLKEIIIKFTDARIIITARPEFTLELKNMAEDHLVIELSGFDSKSRELFVRKVFTSMESDIMKREKKIIEFTTFLFGTCQSLKEHLNLPLTIALLLVLWQENSDKVTSVTTASRLYDQLFNMCKQKLMARLQVSSNETEMTLNPKVKQWMIELGQVAWEMLKEDNHNLLLIREEKIDKLINSCNKNGIDAKQTLSAFLNCDQEIGISGIKHRIQFLHSSAEEYFAAMYLTEEITENKRGIADIFLNIKNQRLKELLKYLVGILKIKGKLDASMSKQLVNVLVNNMSVSSNDSTFWWQLLQEGELHVDMCNAVHVHIQKVSTWYVNTNDSEDSIARASLLKSTNTAPKKIIFDIHFETSLSEHHYIEDLLELLPLYKDSSHVSLYLEKQFHDTEDTTTGDKYFSPLLEKNQLIELRGHIGKDSAAKLVHAYNLQSLFLRISSIEALQIFAFSLSKHRSLKVFFMPSRKWKLEFIELYLNIDRNTEPTLFPKLNFRNYLVLKIPYIRDEHAEWAGRIIKSLNSRYESIIFTNSQLTINGAQDLLNAADGVKIKQLRVFSDQNINPEEVKKLIKDNRINIGWGNN